MSWQVQVSRAKPNPAGKDKSGNYPLAGQLLGEWVDLKNIGDQSVSLGTLYLAHQEFSGNCVAKDTFTIYWEGVKEPVTVLQSGQVVRIHTGRRSDAPHMHQEDASGVNHHAFADSGRFLLNNGCGDILSIWYKGTDGKFHSDDQASYDRNPPEGGVLVRVGAKLVPSLFR